MGLGQRAQQHALVAKEGGLQLLLGRVAGCSAPGSGDLGSSLDVAIDLLCDLKEVTFLLWDRVSLSVTCEINLHGS